MARKEEKSGAGTKAGRGLGTRGKAEIGLPMRFLVVSGRDHMQVSRSAHGKLEDLFLSGLVFQTPDIRQDDLHLSYDESPLIRNKLIVKIDFPGGRRFTAIGEVSWYEKSFVAKDSVYHVGVSFTEITLEDREALKEYLVSKEKMAETVTLDR